MVRSISELAKLAAAPDVDNTELVRRYISSAFKLGLQGQAYLDEGDYEMAYMYFLKFATFAIEKLPKHEKYKSADSRMKEKLTKQCKDALGKMEDLKGLLEARYKEQERQQELAKDLARLQLLEADEQRKAAARQAALSLPGARPVPTAGPGSQNWSALKQLAHEDPAIMPPPGVGHGSVATNAAGAPHSQPAAQLPSVPGPIATGAAASGFDSATQTALAQATARLTGRATGSTLPATAPATAPVVRSEPIIYEELPTLDAGVGNVGGGGVRDVILDRELFEHFMEIAHANTSRNIETCGVLTGVLKGKCFHVTTLIIPRQTGSSDTCQAVDEDQIFDYQDKNDLITLGWIHTHPEHECFLSSVDLHTQFSYQLMLAEAIAIVMAPRYAPGYGIFTVTKSGMDVLRRCQLRGFHQHAQTHLFETAKHVTVRSGNPQYEIVDFR